MITKELVDGINVNVFTDEDLDNKIDSLYTHAIVIDSVEDPMLDTIYVPLIKAFVYNNYDESFIDICKAIMISILKQPIKYCGHEVILNMTRQELEQYVMFKGMDACIA